MSTEPATDEEMNVWRSAAELRGDAYVEFTPATVRALIARIDAEREAREEAEEARQSCHRNNLTLAAKMYEEKDRATAAEAERDTLRERVRALEGAPNLTQACEPWKFHVGEPPGDDSPLSSVYGAGMHYTEELLASLLGVTHYEPGDGSEDFRTDAGETLMNILTAAGLYDDETGQFAALTQPEEQGRWTVRVTCPTR